MAAIVIEGKEIAAKIHEETRDRSDRLKESGINPCLAVILIGENPASVSYVKGKKKAFSEAGMDFREIRCPEETPEAEILSIIASLNSDPAVHGILVQHPFPPHISEDRIFSSVIPEKDVDGFHPVSAGNLVLGRPGFVPGTPLGIVHILRECKIPISGRHAVIVGRSNIVGKPLAMLLARREQNATVTICHTGTGDLGYFTRQADILVAAAGKLGLIKGDMIKEGAAVIDVGTNRVTDPSAKRGFRLKGDVVFDEALERAGWITRVPGGVGPLTIAMLMRNLVDAAEQIKNRRDKP